MPAEGQPTSQKGTIKKYFGEGGSRPKVGKQVRRLQYKIILGKEGASRRLAKKKEGNNTILFLGWRAPAKG